MGAFLTRKKNKAPNIIPFTGGTENDAVSKREIADEEKSRVMQELGRKGAQKRWAKQKAAKENKIAEPVSGDAISS
jgi:hypothetical protein